MTRYLLSKPEGYYNQTLEGTSPITDVLVWAYNWAGIVNASVECVLGCTCYVTKNMIQLRQSAELLTTCMLFLVLV